MACVGFTKIFNNKFFVFNVKQKFVINVLLSSIKIIRQNRYSWFKSKLKTTSKIWTKFWVMLKIESNNKINSWPFKNLRTSSIKKKNNFLIKSKILLANKLEKFKNLEKTQKMIWNCYSNKNKKKAKKWYKNVILKVSKN